MQHEAVNPKQFDAAVINAKGFGGNNASASVLAPHIVNKMLRNKVGENAWQGYLGRLEQTESLVGQYDSDVIEAASIPITFLITTCLIVRILRLILGILKCLPLVSR